MQTLRPAIVRLSVGSNGDWLVVRQRLTLGEQRAAYRRMYTYDKDTDSYRRDRDPLAFPIAMASAYILDWSLTDPDGQPIVIRDGPVGPPDLDRIATALQALASPDFDEISLAIRTHEAAELAKRAAEKKTHAGPPSDARNSPLPSAPDGPSTPSEPLTPTTTTSSLS